MSLPPIFSNLPVFKLFKSDKAAGPAPKETAKPQASTMPQDIINLSSQALEKLKGASTITEKDARPLAKSTGSLLERTDLSLATGNLPE